MFSQHTPHGDQDQATTHRPGLLGTTAWGTLGAGALGLLGLAAVSPVVAVPVAGLVAYIPIGVLAVMVPALGGSAMVVTHLSTTPATHHRPQSAQSAQDTRGKGNR